MAKRRTYVAAPGATSSEGRRRYVVMQRVQAGEMSVTDGARDLGISRVRFQTLLHRGLAAMVAAVEPKPAGRPAVDPQTVRLRRELERCRREKERLQARLGKMEQILELAADVMSRRIAQSRGQPHAGRSRGGKNSSAAAAVRRGARSDDEEPERGAWANAQDALAMRRNGLRPPLVAALLAVSSRTVRRWTRRAALGHKPCGRRGPAAVHALDPERRRTAEDLVRRLHGLVGAESIRHSIDGISRRQAAAVKAEVLTALERERKRGSRHVVVTRPGVMRGFDAIYVHTRQGWRFPLVAADAAVPFRTSVTVAPAANTHAVTDALARDFELHGPPLVLRLDRARAHEADRVGDLLAAHGVLALHGPPHCARYYGQLERQNREHQAWLEACGTLTPAALAAHCHEMVRALSFEWRRPSLAWRTAAEVWNERTEIDDDRERLRDEVREDAARLIESGVSTTMATRLAIEKALKIRGYLHLESWTAC